MGAASSSGCPPRKERSHATAHRRNDESGPRTTEEAQYSLAFPLAVALIHGEIGPAHLGGAALEDEQVLALARRITVEVDDQLSARFPAERYARVRITTGAGKVYESGEVAAAWGPEAPPADEALREKFHALTRSNLSAERARSLESLLWQVSAHATVQPLLATLAAPAQPANRPPVAAGPKVGQQ